MNFIDFFAGPEDQDRRIDKVVRKLSPDTQLTDIYKAFRKGFVKVNGKKIKGEYRLNSGDTISLPDFMVSQAKNPEKKKSNEDLLKKLPEIVYKNEHIIIFNKPYNMLVQGSDSSLDKITVEYYKKNINNDSLAFTPGPLHRLDKRTTGLIAFSLSINGARWFSENIKEHKIEKRYLAILQGIVEEKEIWEDYIEKLDAEGNQFHTVKVQSENNKTDNSKLAYTEVTPLKYSKYKGKSITLCDVLIKTGRTHQIRSQAAYHNHPLVGDTAYGGMSTDLKRELFLHAYKLSFPENPVGLPLEIEIKEPKEFSQILS